MNFRAAIPWRAKALELAEPFAELANQVPTCYGNLGRAQKDAGMWVKALESYDRSQADPGSAFYTERCALVKEMAEWTGASGHMSPVGLEDE